MYLYSSGLAVHISPILCHGAVTILSTLVSFEVYKLNFHCVTFIAGEQVDKNLTFHIQS